MYGQPLNLTLSAKFLGVLNDNHLSIEYHTEHIERVWVLSMLSQLAEPALTGSNKAERYRPEVI